MVRTPERVHLERKALARLEIKRRERVEANLDNTVYGIYAPSDDGPVLLRSLQEVQGEYVEVDKAPTVTVPEKLERFITVKKRFKVAFGGRSGAKSNTFGGVLSAQAKDYGDKTVCLRELQNSIEDSVHALLSSEIKRLGFDGFDVTDKAIRLNGEDVFKFKGLARNPDAVKSMFGFKRAWAEEAQTLSYESISMLTPTIREKDSELWFSLNPGSSEDAVSKRFLEPFYADLLRDGYYEDDLHLIVWINYLDNPWHSPELETERVFDKNSLSGTEYDHKWLGYYNDSIVNALITSEIFDSCIDAHKKLGFDAIGAKYAAHDPSDTGPDSKGYAMRHGSVLMAVEENLSGGINEGGDWATGLAISHRVDHYTWDCDGMGVGLGRQTEAAFNGKPTTITMFKGSESPDNPKAVYQDAVKHEILGEKLVSNVFKNKRAQYYQELRDRCYRTHMAVTKGKYHDPDELISFDSSIPLLTKLRSELCRMPVKPNANGLIELYTKEVMKTKFKVPSPNLADSVMMLMRVEDEQEDIIINFASIF